VVLTWLDSLFASASPLEKKSWGLQLLSKVIKQGPSWSLSSLITPNLSRCLINQVSEKNRYLHSGAKTCLRDMRLRVEKEPSVAASFVCQLLSASVRFDQITRTKTLQDLVAGADTVALNVIIPFCRPLLFRPHGDEESEQKVAETDRRILADLLLGAVKSRSQGNSEPSDFVMPPASAKKVAERNWMAELLFTFTELGFFRPSPDIPAESMRKPALSDASREVFQSRLTSCLAHVISTKLDGNASCPFFVASLIQKLHKSSKTLELAFEGDKAVFKAIKAAQKQLADISTEVSLTASGTSSIQPQKRFEHYSELI
jgi:DNA polymerase phi